MLSEDLGSLVLWLAGGDSLRLNSGRNHLISQLLVLREDAKTLEGQVVPRVARGEIEESERVVRFDLARARRACVGAGPLPAGDPSAT